MIHCAECGHQNAKHYRFCLGCGAELPQQKDSEQGSETSIKESTSSRTGRRRAIARGAFNKKPSRKPSPRTLMTRVDRISGSIPKLKGDLNSAESSQNSSRVLPSFSIKATPVTPEGTEKVESVSLATTSAHVDSQEQSNNVQEKTASSVEDAVSTPAVPTPAVLTPAVLTPAVPTPAVPTPAVPTPAVPTPAVPTPAASSPAASSPAASSPAVSSPVSVDHSMEVIPSAHAMNPNVIHKIANPMAQEVIDPINNELMPNINLETTVDTNIKSTTQASVPMELISKKDSIEKELKVQTAIPVREEALIQTSLPPIESNAKSPLLKKGNTPVEMGHSVGNRAHSVPQAQASPKLTRPTEKDEKVAPKDIDQTFIGVQGASAEAATSTPSNSATNQPITSNELEPQVRASSQALRVCSQCSAIVPKGFAFCGGCGTRYKEDLAQEAYRTPIPMGNATNEDLQYLRLIHIHPDGTEGESLTLNIKHFTIGRNSSWSVFQKDLYLSPKHATFMFQNSELYIKDEGGLNGVFIKLKGTTELNHGDLFRVGQQLLRFERLRNLQGAQSPDGTRTLGSPFYEIWGRLCHIVGQGEVGQAWLLQEAQIELGRVHGLITFGQDRFMSSRHCLINFAQDYVTLTDLESTNGTFLRIQGSIPLVQGDLVLLGQQIFRIDLGHV